MSNENAHSETDLRAEGVRVTRQRLAILHVLREASDHPRAEDILTRARLQDPSVSQATVYRTLAMLEKAGTVLRNEFDGAGARYELADRHHHDHHAAVAIPAVCIAVGHCRAVLAHAGDSHARRHNA